MYHEMMLISWFLKAVVQNSALGQDFRCVCVSMCMGSQRKLHSVAYAWLFSESTVRNSLRDNPFMAIMQGGRPPDATLTYKAMEMVAKGGTTLEYCKVTLNGITAKQAWLHG